MSKSLWVIFYVFLFMVSCVCLYSQTLNNPEINATGIYHPIEFAWEGEFVGYDLQIATSSDFTNDLLFQLVNHGNDSYMMEYAEGDVNVEIENDYHWRIRGREFNGMNGLENIIALQDNRVVLYREGVLYFSDDEGENFDFTVNFDEGSIVGAWLFRDGRLLIMGENACYHIQDWSSGNYEQSTILDENDNDISDSLPPELAAEMFRVCAYPQDRMIYPAGSGDEEIFMWGNYISSGSASQWINCWYTRDYGQTVKSAYRFRHYDTELDGIVLDDDVDIDITSGEDDEILTMLDMTELCDFITTEQKIEIGDRITIRVNNETVYFRTVTAVTDSTVTVDESFYENINGATLGRLTRFPTVRTASGKYDPVFCLHSHGVYYSPYDRSLWITTGDRDSESSPNTSGIHGYHESWIIRATYDYATDMFTFTNIGNSRSWKWVQVIWYDNYMYYAHDVPNAGVKKVLYWDENNDEYIGDEFIGDTDNHVQLMDLNALKESAGDLRRPASPFVGAFNDMIHLTCNNQGEMVAAFALYGGIIDPETIFYSSDAGDSWFPVRVPNHEEFTTVHLAPFRHWNPVTNRIICGYHNRWFQGRPSPRNVSLDYIVRLSFPEAFSGERGLALIENEDAIDDWSESRRFESLVLPAPTLVSPSDNEVDVSFPVELVWEQVDNSDGYNLQVAADISFSNILFERTLSGIDNTNIIVHTLIESNTTYHWRVRGTRDGVTSNNWSTKSFTTEAVYPGSAYLQALQEKAGELGKTLAHPDELEAFILTLLENDILTNLDCLYLAEADEELSLLNITDPDVTAEHVGGAAAVNFTANLGWQSNGEGKCLNTNYNFTSTNQFQSGVEGTFGVYLTENITSTSTQSLFGSSRYTAGTGSGNNLRKMSSVFSNRIRTRFMSAGDGDSQFIDRYMDEETQAALPVFGYLSQSMHKREVNGELNNWVYEYREKQTTDFESTASLSSRDTDIYALAYSWDGNVSPDPMTDGRMGAFWIGGYLSPEQHTIFRQALIDYFTAIQSLVAVNPIPSDNSENISTEIEHLSWDFTTRSFLSVPVGFKVYIDSSLDFTDEYRWVDYDDAEETHSLAVPIDLERDATYFWKVVPATIDGSEGGKRGISHRRRQNMAVDKEKKALRSYDEDVPVWRFHTEYEAQGEVETPEDATESYVFDVNGFQIIFQPAVDEDETCSINIVVSSNPNLKAIQRFSNPTALGRYFRFAVTNSDVFRRGRSIQLEFPQSPNQIWVSIGEGLWKQIDNSLIDWSNPVKPIIDLSGIFNIRFTNDVFEFAGDLGEEGVTLPVELSSFTASITGSGLVEIKWISETETNMLGYNVFRYNEEKLKDAVVVNGSIIEATNTSKTTEYKFIDDDVISGKSYHYWLQTKDLDLTSSFFGPIYIKLAELEEDDSIIPDILDTELLGAYPNPFNSGTNIAFSLEEKASVSITIFNIKGQLVKTLLSEIEYDKGSNHSVYWSGLDRNGKKVGSGVYLYLMETDTGYVKVKKMLLMK